MTAYNFGDVVLVGFPHTDLRGVSKRPAFVIYDAGDLDILVAKILLWSRRNSRRNSQ